MRLRTTLLSFTLLLGTSAVQTIHAPVAGADHPQPPLNPAFMDYTPIGYYGPPDEADTPAGESATVPNPGAGPPPLNNPNPSGKWVAYDTNVWESLTLPSRHPGDNCTVVGEGDCREGDADDDASNPELGTGYTGYSGPNGVSTAHGTCPPHPEFVPWGMCFNNQLEYLDYYEHSMENMLSDFGGTVHRYPFTSPGGGTPRGTYLAASGGQAYNIAAVVPGADHPEETVLVSGHYDFTDSGPGAAWDSAEGHTEVMRMAWLMSNYWRQTGTRPSATIKFIPWDSEESGTFGSIDYVNNNIPPGEEDEVRGYFNVDPCAGAYPAYKDGNFAQRVPEVLQLANPDMFEAQPAVKSRVEAFNAKAEIVVDQVFDYLDDTITTPTGEEPIFVSDAEAAAGNDGTQPVGASQRDEVVTALGGLAIFTSDYANFQARGIPIFNLFPDLFGPHADGQPASGEGISILHTNNDNLTRINRLTSGMTGPVVDPTGTFASEGWAKGQEMCSHVEAWYMLQPEMAGAQTANENVVAYFEALPNEAITGQNVNFDASGTYQYSNVGSRTKHADSSLSYQWTFGDGTTGSGKVVQHGYQVPGVYQATLSVSGPGGSVDTMTIPIHVVPSNFVGPVLDAIDPTDASDGNFDLAWDFTGSTQGFRDFRVDEATNPQVLLNDPAEDITLNWTVTPSPNTNVQPWQHSDSGTPKFRSNQFRSGARSFWTGVSPNNFNPPPTSTQSILMVKNPISVPATGETEFSYWSLFQNESDDRGRVEVALTDGTIPPDQLQWQTVDEVGGSPTEFICNPTEPATLQQGLTNRKVSLDRFAGNQILIRFNYVMGPSNPALSQPCGWYVDDISLFSANWVPQGNTTNMNFPIIGRQNGTYAYRVLGVYTDGITTAGSNPELATVTNAAALPAKALARCLKFPGHHILGTKGKDKLKGTNEGEVLCGFGGKDSLKSKGGDDVALGGGGKDKALGDKGRDRVEGENGGDKLRGGPSKDRLKGGKGKDDLHGGSGKDKCNGGPKKDTVTKC